MAEAVLLQGQLLSKRPLSHRLCFADLQTTNTNEVVELVFKTLQGSSAAHLRGINIGDIIQVSGVWEEKEKLTVKQKSSRQHQILQCSGQPPIVLTAWKDASPNNPFAPMYFPGLLAPGFRAWARRAHGPSTAS